MSDNTSTHYAIRLPDGQLAHDLPAAIMQGHPEYKTLPGGQKAWLWGEDRRHEAYRTLHAIAEHVKPWGAETLMKAHAAVVMVRTTVEILDGDHDPEQDGDTTEPRTWSKAEDIPIGVKFSGIEDGHLAWERVDADRARTCAGPMVTTLAELNAEHPEGFIEEPR